MLREFKMFLMRGNVLDLAIAVILGASFGAIVTSFVSDVLMPPIGRVLGRVSFVDLFVSLNGQSYPTLAAAKLGLQSGDRLAAVDGASNPTWQTARDKMFIATKLVVKVPPDGTVGRVATW